MLITPSLYSAYYWYAVRDYGTTEDFLKVLRREPTEPTEAMQAGIAFEERIRGICEKRIDMLPNTPEKYISDIVQGGFWQVAVSKKFGDNLLYGRCDVVKGDTIYDIKHTSTYDIGKYQYSIQHWLYMYCTGIRRFRYIASNCSDVWFEDYFFDSDTENILRARIADLLSFINANEEFSRIFNENWK